ncbi:TPA: YSIRK-type signal peptide-containing protein, partial [Streptococcus suis]
MFWKEKQTKFSIRKFNLGVASVIIGMTGLLYTIPNEVFSAELPVLAQTNIAREQISYKYVLYSELTSDERARIQATIPARQVGNTHTYYMVYRPKVNLPQTGSTLPVASSFIGLGLLIIGLSLTKDRKKRLVRSLIILTATGSFSVAAISTGSLSGFDKQFTLAVGEVLPQAVISIDQHEFVGFILEGDVNSETVTVTEAVIDEQKSSGELALPNTLAEPESSISPPTEATVPEQPEEVVSPIAPVSEEVSPEQPVVPVILDEPENQIIPPTEATAPEQPEKAVSPVAPVSEAQGDPASPVSPVSEEVVPEQPVISDEPDSPVSPPTEATAPEQPEEVVAPSTPASEAQGDPASPVSPVSEEVSPDQPVISSDPESPVS